MATLSLESTGILGAIAGVAGAAVGATVALNRVGAGAASVAMAVGMAVAGMAVAVALAGEVARGVAAGVVGIAVGAGVAGMAVGAGAGWGAGAAGVAAGAGASVASSPPQATIMAVANTARISSRNSLEGGKILIEVVSRMFLWGPNLILGMRVIWVGLNARGSLSCRTAKGKLRDVGDSFLKKDGFLGIHFLPLGFEDE